MLGKYSRSEVTYIIGRVSYEELTASAKAGASKRDKPHCAQQGEMVCELFSTPRGQSPPGHTLWNWCLELEKNTCGKLSTKEHASPSKVLKDLQKRTELPNPVKLITKRVMEELEGDSKYRLFTRAQ